LKSHYLPIVALKKEKKRKHAVCKCYKRMSCQDICWAGRCVMRWLNCTSGRLLNFQHV